MHVELHFCMYVCIYVWMYVCEFSFMFACMYACLYVCMPVCVIVCIHACLYARLRVCIYVCMFLCMFVHLYSSLHVCKRSLPKVIKPFYDISIRLNFSNTIILQSLTNLFYGDHFMGIQCIIYDLVFRAQLFLNEKCFGIACKQFWVRFQVQIHYMAASDVKKCI